MLHWIPLIVAVLVSLTAAYLRLGLRTWTVATAIAIVGAGLLAGSHWLAIVLPLPTPSRGASGRQGPFEKSPDDELFCLAFPYDLGATATATLLPGAR